MIALKERVWHLYSGCGGMRVSEATVLRGSSFGLPTAFFVSQGNEVKRIESAYVVHTGVLRLGDIPLCANGLRKVWEPFFRSKKCLFDARRLLSGEGFFFDFFHNSDKCNLSAVLTERLPAGAKDFVLWRELSRPHSPFLKRLGSICLTSRTMRLTSAWKRSEVLEAIAKDWDGFPYTHPDNYSFEFDPKQKDQRLNFMCFELASPLRVYTKLPNNINATGHVFVHFYGFGYAVILLAVSLTPSSPMIAADIEPVLAKTRPWSRVSTPLWDSSLGRLPLPQLLTQILESIRLSLFQDPHIILPTPRWSTCVKVVHGETRKATEGQAKRSFNFIDPVSSMDFTRRGRNLDVIVFGKRGTISIHQRKKTTLRTRVTRLFWKFAITHEFTCIKQAMYEDLLRFLKADIQQLRNYRLNITRKLTEEDIIKASPYRPDLPAIVQHFDIVVTRMPGLYRAIYSKQCMAFDHDDTRQALLTALDGWAEEAEKWQHPVMQAWRTALGPIRALLTSKPE